VIETTPERAAALGGMRTLRFEPDQRLGWSALRDDQVGETASIAIIGSGAAAIHPDLVNRLTDGRDVVGEDDKTWREDLIGTGTHQAVLIGGQDDGTGVTGSHPKRICMSAAPRPAVSAPTRSRHSVTASSRRSISR
jgi:subtilisin family serine protease